MPPTSPQMKDITNEDTAPNGMDLYLACGCERSVDIEQHQFVDRPIGEGLGGHPRRDNDGRREKRYSPRFFTVQPQARRVTSSSPTHMIVCDALLISLTFKHDTKPWTSIPHPLPSRRTFRWRGRSEWRLSEPELVLNVSQDGDRRPYVRTCCKEKKTRPLRFATAEPVFVCGCTTEAEGGC